jgi:hypothetical protein
MMSVPLSTTISATVLADGQICQESLRMWQTTARRLSIEAG